MSPLLAPLFAQLITLQVGDRTEGRYVKSSTAAGSTVDEVEQFEGSTSPQADLTISSRGTELSLGYGPSFTLQPLEKKPRDLLVFHHAGVRAGYRWQRTTLSLSSSLGFGELNFRLAPLQGPGAPSADAGDAGSAPDAEPAEPGSEPAQPAQPAPGASDMPEPGQPTTGEPGTGQLLIVDRIVRYYTSTTALTLSHDLAKDVNLSAQVGHNRAGGLDDESRAFYPEISGWFVGVSAGYTYKLSARDAFASNAALVQTWSSDGNQAVILNGQETWQHVFDKRTSSALGAGLNITRFSLDSGLRGFSIFPTFQASLSHQLSLLRGSLGLTLYAYSAPALDPLRALVDPRVGVGANLGYVRKRFSVNVGGGTALSLAPDDNDSGAIDSAQASGRIAYAIAELVEVDAGARYARQAVQGVTVLPSSYAAFVGLNVGYRFRLYGSPH